MHTFVVMVTPRPTTLYGPTSGRNGALNVPSVWPAPAAGDGEVPEARQHPLATAFVHGVECAVRRPCLVVAQLLHDPLDVLGGELAIVP